jgi:SAM-dependent methyltransferase
LRSGKIEPSRYTGIDFSQKVIAINRIAWPNATFLCIDDIACFPVRPGSYGFVFSHYVLEHCVFPNAFLDQCVRALRPQGTLSILSPDFLGVGRITSQRVGLSQGTGREKLARGHYWDALLTAFDSRIRMPLHAWTMRGMAKRKPRFFINLAPTCFADSFAPDIDAVYLTFADEIRSYLTKSVRWQALSPSLAKYSLEQGHIYLKGIKRAEDA